MNAIAMLYLYRPRLRAVAAGATIISTLNPGLGRAGIGDWTQPISTRKVIVFTLLFEVFGFWLDRPADRDAPATASGASFICDPTQFGLRGQGPVTQGDTRTVIDVALYAITCYVGGVWAVVTRLARSGNAGPPSAW